MIFYGVWKKYIRKVFSYPLSSCQSPTGTFIRDAIHDWNALPNELKAIQSLHRFKSKLKRLLLSNWSFYQILDYFQVFLPNIRSLMLMAYWFFWRCHLTFTYVYAIWTSVETNLSIFLSIPWQMVIFTFPAITFYPFFFEECISTFLPNTIQYNTTQYNTIQY